MSSTAVDALMVGGGPGGLSVALGLARQIYSVVVFDSGDYLNARASHMHNCAGWDQQHPEAFRSKARVNLVENYKAIQFETTTTKAAYSLGRVKSWFWRPVQRISPPIPQGMKTARDTECKLYFWAVLQDSAVGVLLKNLTSCSLSRYSCLFCHVYEDLGVPSAGVLCMSHTSTSAVALHISRMARRFTRKVTQ